MSTATIFFQQQRQEQQEQKNSLPSPPNSSCGDEKESEYSTTPLQLPENYTIEHSSSSSSSSSATTRGRRCSTTSTSSSNSDNNIRQKDRSTGTKRRRILSPSLSPYHKCSECGKVYKHPNCLSKHQWEHSQEWEFTSKFLLTKHQQVQLLEAAAILMNMTGKNQLLLYNKKEKVAREEEGAEEDNDDSDIQIDLL